jgi:ubiquinone/menaquinone biosynthesis C-methylase UbiE
MICSTKLRNLAGSIQALYRKFFAYHKAYSNDFLWPLVLPLRQLQLKQLAGKIAQNNSSGSILDIGAGYGYLSIEIAKRCPYLQLVGIDIELELISDGMKNVQEKRLADKVTFLQAKAESLPFFDDGFDMVVSTMSLHLWHDWQSGIGEIRRVLKPGGQAWILVDRHYLLHGLAHITDYFTKRSLARMETLYLSAGFRDCRISELDEILKIVATK